jgi:hypothetical protein
MTSQKTVDIHAHVIAEETMRLMQKEAAKVGPRITPVDADSAVYEVAGVLIGRFRAAASTSSGVSRTWRRATSTCRRYRSRRRRSSTIRMPR